MKTRKRALQKAHRRLLKSQAVRFANDHLKFLHDYDFNSIDEVRQAVNSAVSTFAFSQWGFNYHTGFIKHIDIKIRIENRRAIVEDVLFSFVK